MSHQSIGYYYGRVKSIYKKIDNIEVYLTHECNYGTCSLLSFILITEDEYDDIKNITYFFTKDLNKKNSKIVYNVVVYMDLDDDEYSKMYVLNDEMAYHINIYGWTVLGISDNFISFSYLTKYSDYTEKFKNDEYKCRKIIKKVISDLYT